MTTFYHFHQNNSGGYLKGPACEVFIEAGTAEEANAIALENGLYFDGCSKNLDCDCCGDRWYRAYPSDALENEEELLARIDSYSWSVGGDVPHTIIIIRKGA